MTAIFEALRNVNDFLSVIERREIDFVFNTERQAKSLLKNIFTAEQNKPPFKDLEDLHNIFLKAIELNAWHQISHRMWNRAPWVFFWKKENYLARYELFRNQYKNYLTNSKGGKALRTLIYVYLLELPKNYSEIIWFSRLIQIGLVDKLSESLFIWKYRQQKLHIFTHDEGIKKIASECLYSDIAVDTYLCEEIGLTGYLSQGNYAHSIYSKALEILENNITEENYNVIYRIIQWSENENHELRFPSSKNNLIEALLLPWLDINPNELLQHKIENFLLNYFGDPRINRSEWLGVNDDAVSVIRRWLTGSTLQRYFKILDRNAKRYPENERRHWRYRKAFWWAYFTHKHLNEAWFAFAPYAQYLADQVLDPDERVYGRLVGGGHQRNHAALIMQIENLIITEWSHNGKCRIWTQENENAPKLYQKEYTRYDLTENSEKIVSHYATKGITHHSSNSGKWQSQIASFINRHTNIRLSMNEYMP